jgi:predicted transcriptional regulator
MPTKDIISVQEKFAKDVIKQAKTILTRKHKNASKELYNSITFEIDKKGNILFSYADQGDFVESGRRKGAKPPPTQVILKWVKQKGLGQWRDNKGRYISNKSQAYLISRSISRKGIKPLAWFSNPFEKALDKFPEIMEVSIAKVIEKQVDELSSNTTK